MPLAGGRQKGKAKAKGGKGRKSMDSLASQGMAVCGGGGSGRLFTALRFVHGYRETSGGDRIKAGKAGKA